MCVCVRERKYDSDGGVAAEEEAYPGDEGAERLNVFARKQI